MMYFSCFNCVVWWVVGIGGLTSRGYAGYSGKYAETVSSVFVTNLKTGFNKGDFDKVEVLFL